MVIAVRRECRSKQELLLLEQALQEEALRSKPSLDQVGGLFAASHLLLFFPPGASVTHTPTPRAGLG